MKKNVVFLFLIFLLSAACNKGTIDLSSKENTLQGYSIDGVYDVTITSIEAAGEVISKAKLRLSIKKDSVIEENLKLSVEGVPANIIATIDPANGVAPFKTTVTFTLNGKPKPGKYPIKIVLTGEGGKTKIYSFNLTIPIVDFEVYRYSPGNIYIYNNEKSLYAEGFSVIGLGLLTDTLNLSYSGLPSGVEAIFTVNNQIPSFGTTVSFNSKATKNGTYPISLLVKSSSGIVETPYSTNLILSDHCSSLLDGKFSKFERYVEGVLVESFTGGDITASEASQPNLIYFRANNDDRSIMASINFFLNCNTNTIEVKKQMGFIGSKDVSIEGSGTFNLASKEIILDCVMDNSVHTKFILSQ